MMRRLIAVYGTLKRGRHNNFLFGQSKFLGDFWSEPLYTMRSAGGFPFVSTGGSSRIHLEVFEVTDPRISQDINRLEGFNGIKGDPQNSFYDAISIQTPFGEADMFVAARDVSRLPVVKSGDW